VVVDARRGTAGADHDTHPLMEQGAFTGLTSVFSSTTRRCRRRVRGNGIIIENATNALPGS
jgi:hypothetical protein